MAEGIMIPPQVMQIINALREHTYKCYLVGDCVNALIKGERVMDFDIVCNADLDRIIAIFDEKFKTREDLLPRGELIIINGAMGISVAPFRSHIDGNGKPIYCRTIDEDMHRRTFTAETIALSPDEGIYDRYDGMKCITGEKLILKAIGEEETEALENMPLPKRQKTPPPKPVIHSLEENPECILTAMLKHSKDEADISPYTLKNINANPELLNMVFPYEIFSEFKKILLGRRISETLLAFDKVIFRIFPKLSEQLDYNQDSDYQEYTLYEHTAKAVGYAYPDYSIRLALLLHSIGKIDCAAERGCYTSYDGHAERGVMLAREIFDEFEVEHKVKENVLFLIAHHDDKISPENYLDYVNYYGAEMTRLLLLFQSAHIRAKSSDPLNERISSTLRQLADTVNAQIRPAQPQTVKRKANTTTITLSELKSIADSVGRS